MSIEQRLEMLGDRDVPDTPVAPWWRRCPRGVIASVALHAALVVVALMLPSHVQPPVVTRLGEPLLVELPALPEPAPRGNPADRSRAAESATTPEARRDGTTPRPRSTPPPAAAARQNPPPPVVARAPLTQPRTDSSRVEPPAPPLPSAPVPSPPEVPRSEPPPAPEARVAAVKPEPQSPPAPTPAPTVDPPVVAKETPPKETPARDTPAPETPTRETLARETPARETPREESTAATKPAPGSDAVALAPRTEVRGEPARAQRSGPTDESQAARGTGPVDRLAKLRPRGAGGGLSDGRGGIEGEPVAMTTEDPNYREYMLALRRRIQDNWGYPDEAARNRIGGTLEMEFGLNKEGQLRYIGLRRSSGVQILDDYALTAVKLASPFPPLPEAIRRRHPTGLPIQANFHYIIETSLFKLLR